jgi:hypothetical protein
LRKAQANQIFTYIVAMLVVGLLVVFGYKAIDMMLSKQCDAKKALFEKNLLDFLDEYSDYGSVHEEFITLPCGSKELCFVDAAYFCSGPPPNYDSIYAYTSDPVIIAAIEETSGCTANIFIKGEFTETLMSQNKFSDKVSLEEGNPFRCFEAKSGQVKLIFSGLGRKTRIEQA